VFLDTLISLDPVASALVERARVRGAYLIWRAQERTCARVLVRAGRVEDVATSVSSGHGIHVVDEHGGGALASRDDFHGEPALGLFDRALEAAGHAHRLGVPPAFLSGLAPERARLQPPGLEAYRRFDPSRAGKRLAELEAEIAARAPGLTTTLALSTDVDAWRVVRSDGGDVAWVMPRCVLRFSASSRGTERHTVGASASGHFLRHRGHTIVLGSAGTVSSDCRAVEGRDTCPGIVPRHGLGRKLRIPKTRFLAGFAPALRACLRMLRRRNRCKAVA